jgi:hypothetical protein
MKKLILILSIVALASCQKRGEIYQQPQDFIEINGKVYKLVKVVPADGERSIWIMYPKDTADKMPTVLNYEVQEGKTTRNEAVIKID